MYSPLESRKKNYLIIHRQHAEGMDFHNMALFFLTFNYKQVSDLSVRVSSDFWVTKPIMELLGWFRWHNWIRSWSKIEYST